jgi:hypothetical protein
MGYVTLNLSESGLIEGGMLIDQGTEQTRDPHDTLAVTLLEQDLRAGVFVLALMVRRNHFVPFTWTSDAGDHRAVIYDGKQYGGTLQQFQHRCNEYAHKALRHGWAPSVLVHLPRELRPTPETTEFAQMRSRVG